MRRLVPPLLVLLCCLGAASVALAQAKSDAENYDISGYGMFRYTDQLDTGEDQWSMPLLRVKLAVTLDEANSLVLQGEDTYKDHENVTNWTDAYFQHKWDAAWRFRMGLATIPFGLENDSSTPNRLALDAPTVISRILPGKRDLGLFLFYSPAKYSKLFKEMDKKDFGFGDYGIAALSYYGGQGRDNNAEPGTRHWDARFSYPFAFGNKQLGEIGTSFFTGDYSTYDSGGARVNVKDQMWGLHAFIAPRPWGFQGEYVTGKMPGLNGSGETVEADADGWYAQLAYRLNPKSMLFCRRDEFDGYRKNPTGQPKAEDYERTVFGYRRNIDRLTDVTVEYDKITSNGTDRDNWAAQLNRYF